MDKKTRELIERVGLDPDSEEKKEQLKSKKVYKKFKERANEYDSVSEVLTLSGIDNWDLVKVSQEAVSFAREKIFVNVEDRVSGYEVTVGSADTRSTFVREENFIEALQSAYEALSQLDEREKFEKAKRKFT